MSKNKIHKKVKVRPTDRPTDGRTDKAGCRVALHATKYTNRFITLYTCARLKTDVISGLFIGHSHSAPKRTFSKRCGQHNQTFLGSCTIGKIFNELGTWSLEKTNIQIVLNVITSIIGSDLINILSLF